jgi:hypothetical protein
VIAILAVTADKRQDWIALGHTRELAEESYANNAQFFQRPLYRLVITPKHHHGHCPRV